MTAPRWIASLAGLLVAAILAGRLFVAGPPTMTQWCFDLGSGTLFPADGDGIPPLRAPSGRRSGDDPVTGTEAGVGAFVARRGDGPVPVLLWTYTPADRDAMAAFRAGSGTTHGMNRMRWLRDPHGGPWLREDDPAAAGLLARIAAVDVSIVKD